MLIRNIERQEEAMRYVDEPRFLLTRAQSHDFADNYAALRI